MDPDTRLHDRLRRLEAELPTEVGARPARRSARWSAPVVAGIALLAVATGGAGATIVQEAVRGSPGVFSREGPLYCTRIQEMEPPRAAVLLADLGYRVTWQVEDRDALTSVQTTTPPLDGYIIEGVIHGRDLTLVVERGDAAVPARSSCEA